MIRRQPLTSRLASSILLCLVLTAPAAFAEEAPDWAASVELPEREKAVRLFNLHDLDGWEGQVEKYWSVTDGMIRGANDEPVPASTYLFTKEKYRDFRLLLEVKQTRGEKYSIMHSAVCALGERYEDKGDPYGFRGPLMMFCNDWGIWDAHRRNRVVPAGHQGFWLHPAEKVGDWNQIEILVRGNRIRVAANGKLVFDFTDEPGMLQPSPLGLQLHSNEQPQEWHFRGLILAADPVDRLLTLSDEDR